MGKQLNFELETKSETKNHSSSTFRHSLLFRAWLAQGIAGIGDFCKKGWRVLTTCENDPCGNKFVVPLIFKGIKIWGLSDK